MPCGSASVTASTLQNSRQAAFSTVHWMMPVYVQPELLAGMSAELKARMQGKSCFNFAVCDQRLFEELALLTKSGFDSYRAQGFV